MIVRAKTLQHEDIENRPCDLQETETLAKV
jgi:hypothetical protein